MEALLEKEMPFWGSFVLTKGKVKIALLHCVYFVWIYSRNSSSCTDFQ